MLYAFIFLLFIIISLVYLEDYLGEYKKYVYWGLCCLLVVFSAFRPVGVDPDSKAYEQIFLNNEADAEFLIDPSYMFLVGVFRGMTDDVHFLFLFYAIIGISIKFYAIRRLFPLCFVPLVVYFGNYYILHDYIQMRAAIASAILLLALKPLAEGKRLVALGWLLVANVFHASTLALYPVLFFSNSLSRVWRYVLLAVTPIGTVLFLLHWNFIAALPIPFVQEKMELYMALTEMEAFEELTLKYPFIWIHYAAIVYALYFYDTIIEKCPALPLLLKIMAYALLCYYVLSPIPVIAGRMHELLGIVEVVLLPCVCYTIRPLWCGRLAVCVVGVIELVFTLFVWNLLDFSMA